EGATIDRAIFEAAGRRAEIVIDGEALRIFDRESFDGTLLREAVSAGAEHVPARAVACRRTPHGWDVVTPNATLRGGWLLGADGACGIVRKTVAAPFERFQVSIASGS